MNNEPIDLDAFRRRQAQASAELRRSSPPCFQSHEAERDRQQVALEALFMAEEARTWSEAAAKARHVINLYAATPQAQDPDRKALIATALRDLSRMMRQEKETQ